MRKYLLYFIIAVFASCTHEDDITVEDNRNDNLNVLGGVLTSRVEMPHVSDASSLVPHYVMHNSQKVLNYTVDWNGYIRHSRWVAYTWDSTTTVDDQTVKRQDKFKWDVDIPSSNGGVTSTDYTKNGYDKGHICASEDRVFCQEANDQTFYYSNMSPQFSSFNQGFWRVLEAKVRNWGRSTFTGVYDTVYVVKGGTTSMLLHNYVGKNKASDGAIPMTDANGYSPRADGKAGLPVPEYYYMALMSVKQGIYRAIAFLVPHSEDLPRNPSDAELEKYVVSVDKLEEFTGIDFFCNIIDRKENEAEKSASWTYWNR